MSQLQYAPHVVARPFAVASTVPNGLDTEQDLLPQDLSRREGLCRELGPRTSRGKRNARMALSIGPSACARMARSNDRTVHARVPSPRHLEEKLSAPQARKK